MEEWVGLKWHDYVTRQAMGEFPEYAVHLKDEARTLGVMFRAMGGDPALSLVTAEPRHFQIRRRFLQKLTGSCTCGWQPSRRSAKFTTTAGCKAIRPWCRNC